MSIVRKTAEATLGSEQTNCFNAPAKHTPKLASRAFHVFTSIASIPHQALATLVAFQLSMQDPERIASLQCRLPCPQPPARLLHFSFLVILLYHPFIRTTSLTIF